MANKKKGYIPLYRSIQEHWVWANDEPFSKGQAWIDLLLSVNHETKKINVGMKVVTIKPGQMWTSYVKLGKNWNWSRTKVYRYIKMLKSDGMIVTDETPNGTLLTIVNYDNFAHRRNANDTSIDTTDDISGDTSTDTSTDTQTIIINNNNNVESLIKEPAPPSDGGNWQ